MDYSPKTQARTLSLPHLRQARTAQGIGLRQLERITGVSRDTILDLEAGRRRAYRKTILALAEALGTTPETLTANQWTMSDKERKALARLIESGCPQPFFNDEETDTNGE